MAVKPDPAIALWVADVVQVQTLSSLSNPTAEHLKLIKDSADRLWQILNGQLTPETAQRMKAVAEMMAAEIA